MGSFPVPSACLPPHPPNPQLSPTSTAPQVWGLLPGGPRPRPALGLGGGPLPGGTQKWQFFGQIQPRLVRLALCFCLFLLYILK